MSKPWMAWYCSDFVGETMHLSAAETGAYTLLRCHYWIKGGLPDDEKQLARISRLPPKEWSDARDALAALFEPGWRHSGIDAEIQATQEAYNRRAKAGSKGGKAKATDKQCSSNASALPQRSGE